MFSTSNLWKSHCGKDCLLLFEGYFCLIAVCLRLLKTESDNALVSDLLRWLQKACILHERNRQMIMEDVSIVKQFKILVGNDDAEVVKNVCALFRYLILDDDIRVEFGKAHEHARTLAVETLTDVTKLLFSMSRFYFCCCSR